ncbi:MAG: class IV adenylate cyclase [Candidatus Komeilibacteria bacterium]
MSDPKIEGVIPGDRKEEKETQPLEIERKFLIKKLPENLEQYPHEEIAQGYLAITEDGTEVRLRKKGEKYFQTVKSGVGKTRHEAETEINQEQFETFWSATEGKRIIKTRYYIPHEGGVLELDIYGGDLTGLITVEKEFATLEECDKFVPPDWLGSDVSNDKRYKNQNLAVQGRPKIKDQTQGPAKERLEIPEFNKEEGLVRLVELIKEREAQSEGNVVVEIAGGSASGKTSAIADTIKRIFGEEAMILSADDYYRGKPFMIAEAKKGNVLNWDQPEAINLPLFREHLEQLKRGQEIAKPSYDFKTAEVTGTETVKPKKIIIAEGLFVLDDTVKDVGDVKAFIDIGTHGRIVRRLLRDVERTGQKPADILKYFSQVVEPMHDKYIESTRKNADLIINNEYNPEVEAERSGLHEVQLKFKSNLDQDKIRRLGGEKLGTTRQVDNYYNPKDRDLMKTGEILRIRQEGEEIMLTYKGPKVESEFRERPKFEFAIDAETEAAFLDIYGSKKKTITKERTLYQLDGVTLSADRVSKNEDGQEVDLGSFVEIRSTNKGANEDKVRSVIQKLGLDMTQGIKESYFEM